MSLIIKVLRYLLNKRNECCCLCFHDLGENSHCIKDEIFLELKHPELSIEMLNIVSFVLGFDVSEFSYLSDKVCAPCTRSLINSYVFIKMCKRNFQILSDVLSKLTLSDINKTDKLSEFNALYIKVDEMNTGTELYYDKKLNSTPGEVIKRLKILHNKPSGITLLKSFTENKPKKISRKVRPTPFIPLTDIAYESDDADLKCKTCHKIYTSTTKLKRHYTKVHAPKKFKCSQCSKCYGSSSLLTEHKKESHCTLVCFECGKTYHNRHTFRVHELSHKLKIICQDCGKIFKYKRSFRKHNEESECQQKIKKTASEKFTCDICNKQYAKKGSLRIHIEYTHGNREAHVCTWCNKKFHAQCMLKAHIVTHTKEKNFNCNICGGKFVTKESLLYHTRLHTGEKPYACELCDKSFLSSSRRIEHVRREHMGPTLECDICYSKFKTGGSLRCHKKRHSNPNSKLYNIQNI